MPKAERQMPLGKRLLCVLRSVVGGHRTSRSRKADTERILQMYHCFREILANNDSTLQLISDIEDRLTGQAPFSFNVIAHRIQKAVMNVFIMIRSLETLQPGKFNQLNVALWQIDRRIGAFMRSGRNPISGPLVIPLAELRSSDAALVGNKMANLGEIRNVVGLRVPGGFAVTTAAFDRVMRENGLYAQADRLDELLEFEAESVIVEACRKIRQAVIDAPIPEDIEKAILGAYDGLDHNGQMYVAMRSSGVREDTEASHAGIYHSELNVGRDWLIDAYRWVLASVYKIQAVLYHLKCGLSAGDVQMAAGCLEMVDARYSGVVFSRSFEDPTADKVVISVTAGLSDPTLNPDSAATELVVSGDGQFEDAPSGLNRADLHELVVAARTLEAHFGMPQDIEWAIDHSGRLFILQSRPMVAHTAVTATGPDRVETDMPPILQGGLTACPGVGAGTVRVVTADAELLTFPEGGVLAARHSTPRFAQVLNRCAAVVTEEGSPIGHMGILVREYGVPTIVALRGAIDVLGQNDTVTVDATTRRIYSGIVGSTLGDSDRQHRRGENLAVTKLRALAKYVTPLNLIDPASPDFQPGNCRTLHDLTRFVHEKVFEVMFRIADRASSMSSMPHQLLGRLPFPVLVLDVGGALLPGTDTSQGVGVDGIASVPMRAFLAGLTDARINLDQPRAVSARGFASVVGESIGVRSPAAIGVGRSSFVVASDRYMNFGTKAGYHFSTVDTYCGKSLNKNYIHFRFEGGAAAEERRERRCRFLSIVLRERGFDVHIGGDKVMARLEKYECDFICSRLTDLGRLTLICRQLDMLMNSDSHPEYFARMFLSERFEKF
jgi:pyruvate,water dikinase